LSADQFHLNDRSYDCLGHLLAQSLRSAATLAAAPVATTPVPAPAAGTKLQPAAVKQQPSAEAIVTKSQANM
jgi:hypothetical protein